MKTVHEGVVIAKEAQEIPKTLSKTYEQVALQFIDEIGEQDATVHVQGVRTEAAKFKDISRLFETAEDGSRKLQEIAVEAIIRFAHSLDKFKTLSPQLELIALYKAREIDREFMTMLIEALGKEKSVEIATELTARHKHSLGK